MKIKSILFVLIQFACLGILVVTGPLIADTPALLIIQLFGFGLGLWAVLSMRIGNFHILPDPFIWSRLVTSGPYRLIRHPMYLGSWLFPVGLTLLTGSLASAGVCVVILVFYFIVSRHEERLLLAKHGSEYRDYMAEVPMLLPFRFRRPGARSRGRAQ